MLGRSLPGTVLLVQKVDVTDKAYSGGFSLGVPPLPIPNREVKPKRADGTAPQCGRVGRRLFFQWRSPEQECSGLLLFCYCFLVIYTPFIAKMFDKVVKQYFIFCFLI